MHVFSDVICDFSYSLGKKPVITVEKWLLFLQEYDNGSY